MSLQNAEYDTTALALDRTNSPQTNPDSRLRVQFGLFPEIDEAATANEARPIYKESLYITIMVPGDRDVVHRRAWARDFQRFPVQHQAFLLKKDQEHAGGTPLKIVPWLSLGQVKELEFFNCYTLEQLAGMPDSTSMKFLQIQKLKQLAKDHLHAASEAAPLTKLRAELDDRDNRIATMERQMADMNKVLERLKVAEDE